MNFLTVSSLFALVGLGTLLGVRSLWFHSSTQIADALSSDSLGELSLNHSPRSAMTLDDVPPPDDTYTPEHRRYS